MGADNWRVCPKCLATKQAKYEDAIKRHEALIADLRKDVTKPDECLAEYYDIRVCEDGEFLVSYGATCHTGGCHFNFEYEHKQQVTLT